MPCSLPILALLPNQEGAPGKPRFVHQKRLSKNLATGSNAHLSPLLLWLLRRCVITQTKGVPKADGLNAIPCSGFLNPTVRFNHGCPRSSNCYIRNSLNLPIFFLQQEPHPGAVSSISQWLYPERVHLPTVLGLEQSGGHWFALLPPVGWFPLRAPANLSRTLT